MLFVPLIIWPLRLTRVLVPTDSVALGGIVMPPPPGVQSLPMHPGIVVVGGGGIVVVLAVVVGHEPWHIVVVVGTVVDVVAGIVVVDVVGGWQKSW